MCVCSRKNRNGEVQVGFGLERCCHCGGLTSDVRINLPDIRPHPQPQWQVSQHGIQDIGRYLLQLLTQVGIL